MARSGRRHSVGRFVAVSATALLIASGGTAQADEVSVQGEVIVPDETVREETITREETAATTVDSAYGEPIDMRYVDAENDAFAYERAPNKAAGVAESLGGLIFNSFFFPVKLVIGTGGAFVGGVTGAMSGGDERAAAQIWNVTTDGSYFVTPSRMEGRSQLRLTGDHP
jgi:hypothetical protein